MIQNTNTAKTPFSQIFSVFELRFVLLTLTVMLHIVFGLPEFANETVEVFVQIKELLKNAATNQIMFSLLSVFYILIMFWLCGHRRAQDRLEWCCLKQAKKDLDFRFKIVLGHVDHLQKINALNLKSATKQDLPSKLQYEIDEFREDSFKILQFNLNHDIVDANEL